MIMTVIIIMIIMMMIIILIIVICTFIIICITISTNAVITIIKAGRARGGRVAAGAGAGRAQIIA